MTSSNLKSKAKEKLPRLAILGAGGLGREFLAVLEKRACLNPVAILDREALLFEENGLNLKETYLELNKHKSVAPLKNSLLSQQTIYDLIKAHGEKIDCIFYALPNLPNDFIYQTTKELINLGFQGVIVDALKRTSAFQLLSKLSRDLRAAGILYVSGCGATPGLLTAVSQLAAQSFVEIKSIEITFGVGISNWESYRATIREDIAHLRGYSPEKASQMTEDEVSQLLEKTKGVLKLEQMEHADDIMLELAGVCPVERVTVGGIVDTRNPKKPISTNVKICGVTYLGEESTHQFILGDQTNMAANVCGTAVGYLNAAFEQLKDQGLTGFYSALDLMPRFSRSSSGSQNQTNSDLLESKMLKSV